MAVTPIWLRPPTFRARSRKSSQVSTTIPLKLIRPLKTMKPQMECNHVEVIRSRAPYIPKRKLLNSNNVDTFNDDATYGFITRTVEQEKNLTATLTILKPDEAKDIIANSHFVPSERCGLVRLNVAQDVSLASVPDFGDLAASPIALKIALKWMFEWSEITPQVLKDLWLKCSPVLAKKRNEARLSLGGYKWQCPSMSSRLKLFKVCKPISLDVALVSECSYDSLSSMDGREYEFSIKCDEKLKEKNRGSKFCSIAKVELYVLVWNYQGVAQTSFKGNLNHLLKAHKPDIVVLLEMRNWSFVYLTVTNRILFDHHIFSVEWPFCLSMKEFNWYVATEDRIKWKDQSRELLHSDVES